MDIGYFSLFLQLQLLLLWTWVCIPKSNHLKNALCKRLGFELEIKRTLIFAEAFTICIVGKPDNTFTNPKYLTTYSKNRNFLLVLMYLFQPINL